jgi:hypothetical protein
MEGGWQGSTAIMMRNSLAVGSLSTILGLVLITWWAVADDQPKPAKPLKAEEPKELIDTFLQSLQPKDGEVTPESDRCPGETPADRADEEMAPLTDPDEAPGKPSEDAATGELTDEPKTLPDVPEVKPIKPAGKEKPVAGPVVNLTPTTIIPSG